MKRVISLLLTLMLVLSFFPASAFAEESTETTTTEPTTTEPTITAVADKTEAAIGDTVEVTFSITNNPGFNNVDAQLDFGNDVLKFTGLKTVKVTDYVEIYDGIFGGGTVEVNTTEGSDFCGKVLYVNQNNVSTDDGPLFVAQFEVIGAGSASVGLTVNALQDVADDGTVTEHTPVVVNATEEIAVAGTPANSVTLDQTALTLEEGTNYLLTATAEPTDTTDEIVWSTSDANVATVENGQVWAVAAGTATITAWANENAYAECAVTVNAEESIIKKSPTGYSDFTVSEMTGIKFLNFNNESIPVKNIYKLSLDGNEEFYLTNGAVGVADGYRVYKLDGTLMYGDATWGSNITQLMINQTYSAVFTKDFVISYDELKAAVGESNIAKCGVTEEDTIALMVFEGSLFDYAVLFDINPIIATAISIDETKELKLGESTQLKVSYTPSGASDPVSWTSSDESVATVDADGNITALKNGSTTITATAAVGETVLSDTCELTVVTKIENIPSNGDYSGSLNEILVGVVDVIDYSWSDKTVNIFVDSSTNTTATLKFNYKHSYNQSGSATADVTVADGAGSYTGFTNYGDWVVNFVPYVSATGISLNKDATEIRIGDSETLTAELSPEGATASISWASSDTSIAKVNSSGKVTAVAAGDATITVSAGELSAECKVTVYAVPATAVTISGEGIENGKLRLLKGAYLTPTITIEPENSTEKASYAIADTSVATVYSWSNQITAKAAGTTTYTVTVGSVSAELEVEVYEINATALTLDNSTLSMNYGDSVTLTATVSPENHTDGSVSWESSDSSVVTVNNGTVKAVGGGTATVTASLGTLSAECIVTVAEPYKMTENLPALDDPYGYGVKLDHVYIAGAEVVSVSWDETDPYTCNVVLSEDTADGTTVNVVAHASFSWGSKEFSGSGTVADGACAVAASFSDWWGSANLTFNFTVEKVAVPEEGYYVRIDKDSTVAVGETAQLEITVDNEQMDTYNAYYLILSYDNSVIKYTGSDSTITDNGSGSLTIAGYGPDRQCGVDNIVLPFEAITSGSTDVAIISANVDYSAMANSQDAPEAAIIESRSAATVTVRGYTVTLTDDFSGAGVVTPGETYSFEAVDKNYDYVVSATMGGTEATVSGSDGIYSIADVSGDIVITASKTPKTFTASVSGNAAADVTADTEATYLSDYGFTLSDDGVSVYELSVTVGGADYAVSNVEGTYTIPGADVTGNIVITVNKTTPADTNTSIISFTGTGSGDVVGGTSQSAANGADFSFTVNADEDYIYTVKLGDIELTAGEDGKYTVSAGNITGAPVTVSVEKTAKYVMEVKVAQYMTLDSDVMWLVTASGVKDGTVLAYDGNTMFWSDKYNAYAWLVISAESEDKVLEAAEAAIAEVSAAKKSVAYDMDVNNTEHVDINDAQLVYNMYNAAYKSFGTVPVGRFLEADVNGNAVVDTTDAAAIVYAIVNPQA